MDRLDAHAAARGCSRSELIARVLSAWLEEAGDPPSDRQPALFWSIGPDSNGDLGVFASGERSGPGAVEVKLKP